MMSTAEKVLSQWIGHKKQRDGSYRGNCPYRAESDSNAFVLKLSDGEHGAYIDHAGNESGSLYDLAEKMGIALPENGRVQVESTKRAYDNLEDYAKRHYASVDVFHDAGWQDDTVYGRPAISYKTQSGTRARFIDGKDDQRPYTWVGDNNGNCWYGLQRAINMAHQKASPLVLCNGEASTIVAQHYGVPAFCGTGGEGAISNAMLEELKQRWNGQVYIALDCDDKGEKAASDIQKDKLPDATIIDLGLSDKGDLADFCGLHRDSALSALKRLAGNKLDKQLSEASTFIEFVDSFELLSTFQKFVWDDPSLFGRVVEMPFAGMRATGGFAELMTTKKIWLIGNISGGGKTILSESLCDGWNAMGYNTFYIGDEWTPMEMIARQLMRAAPDEKPVSYMDYLRYVEGKREISDMELTNISLASRTIRSREGRTYYMQVNKDYRGVAFLEDIMEAAGDKVASLKQSGVRIDVIILDYLSLYDTRAQVTGNNVEEYKAGILKSWCKSLDVLGVSTVQVKKEAEERVKTYGGFLTQHDLYWIRADKGNLITTMNRVYKTNFEVNPSCDLEDKQAFKPFLDENGNPEQTPNFCMVTAKNSVASPFEYSYFHFDFDRMAICEGLHPDYHYDQFYRIVMRRDSSKTSVPMTPVDISHL